jgi:hypothetical protein
VSLLFAELRLFLIEAAVRAAGARLRTSREPDAAARLEQHLRALGRAKADAIYQLQEGSR